MPDLAVERNRFALSRLAVALVLFGFIVEIQGLSPRRDNLAGKVLPVC